LKSRSKGKPLFLCINFQDTHFPYYHPAMAQLVPAPVVLQGDIEPRRAADVRAMYLNTVANVDRAVGDVLAQARTALGREPGVIVVSDHGESLFDEDFLGHGYALNEAQTRIPLIVSGLPLSLREPVGQVDLRAAVNEALSTVAAPSRPTLRPAADRRVFQYIGTIAHPAQIALTGLRDRAMFDFRSSRGRVDGGEWSRLDSLSAADRDRVLAVVHTWERIVLARQGGAAPASSDP
jgi:arylsulfatase A-like enzyme